MVSRTGWTDFLRDPHTGEIESVYKFILIMNNFYSGIMSTTGQSFLSVRQLGTPSEEKFRSNNVNIPFISLLSHNYRTSVISIS